MTDEEFLAAFETCRLPEADWTHAAHVRMAWLSLRKGPFDQVLPRVRAGIQRYNATLQKLLAYHETITRAFLRLVHQRMSADGAGQTFDAFCRQNPDLLQGVSVLLRHYRRETLFSPQARAQFVLPDLEPLPEPT